MQYKISGEIAQQVTMSLERGETLWAANGSLMAYSESVRWNLRVPGGVGGALKRSFAGEGISLTYVEASQGRGSLLLAANQPGHIIPWNLEDDGPVVTTRGSFLAAWGAEIDISITVAKRAGAAFFGGAGLFLQTVSGRGTVLVHGSGDFFVRKLAAGESLNVSTGNLAAFAHTVDYDIRGWCGCRKSLFGSEGLFVTHLSGPGRVLLQTLKRTPVSNRSASS